MMKLSLRVVVLVGAVVGCRAFHPLTMNDSLQFRLRSRSNVHITWPKNLDALTRQTLTQQKMSMEPLIDGAQQLATSLFQYDGNVPLVQAFGINFFLFTLFREKLLTSLTPQGYLHAMALGTGLWTTLGWRAWTFCVLYLILGQLEKEKRGIAEARGGRRGPENVWGSAATGLGCAICSVQGASFMGLPSGLFVLGYVASIATKLADTFASEIGKAYGETTFLITTLERVEPGTEGAVSAEGTAASALGGLLLTLYGYAIGLITVSAIPISVGAAFVATNIESLLGATLQGKPSFEWVTNEVINFINTLIGASLAILAGSAFL